MIPNPSIPCSDYVCFNSEYANNTLPDKCNMLYQEAIQVKSMYFSIIFFAVTITILLVISIIFFYMWLKKMNEIKKSGQNG